jgi:hypothetical protein
LIVVRTRSGNKGAETYHLIGLIPEDFKMNAATIPTIKMPNQGNFIKDDSVGRASGTLLTDGGAGEGRDWP